MTDEKGIEKAPNIIILEDQQKFKDENCNVIEIETRGELSVDKIYFRVKDVSLGFQMENLQNILIKSNANYSDEIDYKYFNSNKEDSSSKTSKTNKELYLTYQGMLRVLFISRNGKTTSFIKCRNSFYYSIRYN